MRRNISPGSSRRIPLTGPAFGDIVTPLKWHRRRRTRKGGTQRGTQMVKVPCVRGGGTTPEPPGKGPGRDPPVTVGHKRQDVRAVLPGVPRFGVTLRALRDGQLFPAPPKIPPGFARPVFRSARLTVVLLPGAPRFGVTFRLLATHGFPPTRAGVRGLWPLPSPSLRSIRAARDGSNASCKQGGTVGLSSHP